MFSVMCVSLAEVQEFFLGKIKIPAWGQYLWHSTFMRSESSGAVLGYFFVAFHT